MVLNNKRFQIVDVSNIFHDQSTEEKIRNKNIIFSKKLFDKKNNKEDCPVKYLSDKVIGRFPPKIWHAKLINAKDLSHCSPIVRTITFIKKDTKCFSDLGKGMYLIKTKQYIVGYESWTSQLNGMKSLAKKRKELFKKLFNEHITR